MKKLVIAAALLLSASVAQAGENYSFDIGGRTVRIHAPRGCDSPSCISISIPGVYDSGRKDFSDDNDDDRDVRDAPRAAAPAAAPAPSAAPAAAVAAQAPAAPAIQAPVAQQAAAPAPTPAAEQASTVARPVQQNPAPATVVAAAPAAAPVQAPPPVAQPVGPLGMWLTEKKEGRVRIEECGADLCGYSVDARTNQNKEKVLINMKPGGSKWSGKIYDPKSGSTYSSTIAMQGDDKLRVQGCAFGGMFCGGQTWTRAN